MNDKIAMCRNLALDILKLSRKELERGLALHRDAVVCDAFCLGFACAPDGEKINRAMTDGAPRATMRDMMSEMSILNWTAPEYKNDLKIALDASGLTGYFQNVEADGNIASLDQLKRLARFIRLTDTMGNTVRKALSSDDIATAKREGRSALFMSMNHVPTRMRLDSVAGETEHLQMFADLGLRMAHLTYNRRNMIGDGCYEDTNAGLSDFGKHVVREMNRVGVIVDVAHSGRQTCVDAAKVSQKPIVASHTTCCGLHEHPRGKPDEVIRAIADTGGYIGVTFVPAFLGGSGDIKALLAHLDYAIRKFGADHVAIGTDIPFAHPRAAGEAAKFPRPSQYYRASAYPPFESGIGPATPETEEQLMSMELTNWPLFTAGLARLGHSDENVRKVIGGNVLRVAKANFTWASNRIENT